MTHPVHQLALFHEETTYCMHDRASPISVHHQRGSLERSLHPAACKHCLFKGTVIEMQAELSKQMVIVLNISYWYFNYPASRLELVNLETCWLNNCDTFLKYALVLYRVGQKK